VSVVYCYFNPFPAEVIKNQISHTDLSETTKLYLLHFPLYRQISHCLGFLSLFFPIRWEPQIPLYKEITSGTLTRQGRN